jgi:hypothetical protein
MAAFVTILVPTMLKASQGRLRCRVVAKIKPDKLATDPNTAQPEQM